MTTPLYDIVFTGTLVEGTEPEQAKSGLAQLFKTTPDKVSRLFNGKPQLLKRGVNKADALKYKAALHQAGLVVGFKAHEPAPAASTTEPVSTPNNDSPSASALEATATATVTPQAKAPAPQQSDEDWSLSPAGSDLLRAEEKAPQVEADIDTSNIKMVSAFMTVEETVETPPPAPDTSHISVAAAGEDLLAEKPEPPPPLPLDLESLSVAPAGTELEEVKEAKEVVDPDISQLSMADVGADILEGVQRVTPPPAPDTSHIALNDN